MGIRGYQETAEKSEMKTFIRNTTRIIVVVLISMANLLLLATPAFAINNPNNIDFGTGIAKYYKVFYNVLETGDWLVAAEGYVNYAVEPTDYDPEEAFLFELVDTDAVTTLASKPLQAWGDRPIGIYLTATQVTTLGLTTGAAYVVRITPNPALFDGVNFGGGGAVEGTNQVSATLGAQDYSDQDLGDDGGVPTSNNLRNGMITVAENMEANDTPADSYLATVQGYQYLSLDGGDLFIEGIPGLQSMCPILFQSGIEPMNSDAPESTGAYALTLTPAQKWGNTVANGLTTLGVFLGINQALAGSVMLFVLVIAFAVFIYQQTESGVTVLLMVATTPFLGAYLGLMPIALAFIFVIIVITLLGYFFFSRGAL